MIGVRDKSPEPSHPPQLALAKGSLLGDYEIEGLLGSGGMGEVYRARDPHLGRDVAIKVLPSFLSADRDRLRRFEQEARAAAALNHPNLVAVFQFGIHRGAPYLVMELLDGETLRDHLKRGPLSARKAVDYAVQIARGLAAAHDKGIVHRDLKPENIFVCRDERVKILDFGLAKLVEDNPQGECNPEEFGSTTTAIEDSTKPGVVLGTVGYMSPEQVRGRGADHRSDIFAFSAILYEMLSGKRAFHKPTSAETMSAVLREDPITISQLAPNVPPAVQRLVHHCLEKNPEQRFQSASDLAFALESVSDLGSSPVGVLDHAKSPRLWMWMAAGGIAIGMAGAGAAWWWLGPQTPQVESIAQLTNDGEPKEDSSLVSDGSRVYFNEGQTGSWRVAQVSVAGGQSAPLNIWIDNPQISGFDPESSTLLALTNGTDNNPRFRLWSIPVPAGEPRRLGDIEAQDANLFPDGRIVFARGNALYVAEKDGSRPRRLAEDPNAAEVWAPAVSPDGKRISFTASLRNPSKALELKEVSADGKNLHEVVKSTAALQSVCCGKWTPDGRYVVFQNMYEGRLDLWAISSRRDFLGHSPTPMRLTNGPLSYTSPLPSRDPRRIFAIGSQRRGELVRYDTKLRQFVPFISGISATAVTFSSDGKWVAYASYPDNTLWRSRSDGSERAQLTYSPMQVYLPSISPDGTKVAFNTPTSEVYVIADAGAPEKVVENGTAASWSPDGNVLLFTCPVLEKHVGEAGFQELKMIDLRTRKISEVPNSQGKFNGQWVTQNTLVA
jgi:serine/threonine protein kinase